NSSSTRSTPCVEGCWGPMFKVICLRPSCRGSSTLPESTVTAPLFRSGSLIFLTRHRSSGKPLLVGVAVLETMRREILPQRVPLPVVRHHDAAKVRMITEGDAEQVVGFALVPVGALPDTCDGINLRTFAGDAALQAEPLIPL